MTGEILIPEFASPALRSSVEEKEAFPFFQALIPLALEIGFQRVFLRCAVAIGQPGGVDRWILPKAVLRRILSAVLFNDVRNLGRDLLLIGPMRGRWESTVRRNDGLQR